MPRTNHQMLVEVMAELNAGEFTKDWKKLSQDIKTDLTQKLGKAVGAGFSVKKLEPFEKQLKKLTSTLSSKMKEMHQAEKDLAAATTDEARKAVKVRVEGIKQEIRDMDKKYKKEWTHVDRLVKRRGKAIEEIERRASLSRTEKLEEAADVFENRLTKTFDNLKAGPHGWADLLKNMGKGASAKGDQMGVSDNGMMKQMGGLLSKLGPALVAIGAVAAGLAAIVKILVDADSAAKEFNKALLDTGATVGDMGSNLYTLDATLGNLRDSFSEFSDFNHKWGTTAKEQIAILGGYMEAGQTMKELTSGAKGLDEEMRRLKDSTAGAVAYSKLLGTTSADMAGHFSEYMDDLGVTLGGIEERFSAIRVKAMEGGFGVKRFFAQVLQATSGMTMYNVRLEESASLLMTMSKILGQKVGAEFFQDLAKGKKGESTQDSVRNVKLVGEGLSKKIGTTETVNQATEFARKFQELQQKDRGKAALFQEGMGAAGNLLNDPKAFAEAISKMSVDQFAAFQAKATATDPELAKGLSSLYDVSQVLKGTLGGNVSARQSYGAAASLWADLNSMQAVIGKRLDEIAPDELENKMAAEHVTGKDAERLRQAAMVGRDYAGKLSVAKEYQGKGQYNEFNEQYGKSMGLFLDEGGKLFRSVTKNGVVDVEATKKGTEIKGLGDLVMSSGEELANTMKEQVPEDIKLAQIVASNTTEISKILEQGVEYWLMKISNLTEGIYSVITGSASAEEKAAKEGARRGLVGEAESAQKNLFKANSVLRALQAENNPANAEKIKEAQAQVEAAQAQSEQAAKALEVFRDLSGPEVVTGIEDPEKLRALYSSAARAAAGGQDARDQAALGGLKKLKANGPDSAMSWGDYDSGDFKDDLDTGSKMAELVDEAKKNNLTSAELEKKLTDYYSDDKMHPIDEGTQKEISTQVKQYKEKERKDKLRFEDTVPKKQADLIQKAFTSVQDDSAMASALADFIDPKDLSDAIRQIKTGQIDPALAHVLEDPNFKDTLKGKSLSPEMRASLSAAPAHDMLLQMGSDGVKWAHRVDPEDVGVVAKKGGALDRAPSSGGGPPTVVHNHFYNDGKGIWNSLRNWERARGK